MIGYIFGGIIFAIFLCAISANDPRKEIEKTKISTIKEALYTELESKGFHSDVGHYYAKTLHDIFVGIAVDDTKKLLCVSSSKDQHDIIPFSEVIGCEIKEDSSVVGGVGRAVVGGVIAGGAGAIVGANTAKKKKVYSFQVVIYIKDVKCPQIVLSTLWLSAKTTDDSYRDSLKFANNVSASIKAIVSQNEDDSKITNTNSKVQNQTYKEKLIQLEDLRNSGLISNNEYDQKREEVIKSI